MIVPAHRSVEERQIITRLLSGEHVTHFDTVRLRKDGSSIDVALTIITLLRCASRSFKTANIVLS